MSDTLAELNPSEAPLQEYSLDELSDLRVRVQDPRQVQVIGADESELTRDKLAFVGGQFIAKIGHISNRPGEYRRMILDGTSADMLTPSVYRIGLAKKERQQRGQQSTQVDMLRISTLNERVSLDASPERLAGYQVEAQAVLDSILPPHPAPVDQS